MPTRIMLHTIILLHKRSFWRFFLQYSKGVVYYTATLSIEASPMAHESLNRFLIFTQPPYTQLMHASQVVGCVFT